MFKSIVALFSFLVLVGLMPEAFAQQLPMPPLVRIVVPFAAGSSTDAMGRALAAQLSTRLGTNVIVENRAGGSGLIGASAVAKGPRDGSMLLFTSVSMITAVATLRTASFDPIGELVPVALVGEGPLVVAVSTKTEIKTPADLVAAARARPDALTHGTAGVGTLSHLSAEFFNDAAKVQIKHIPYKGAALAVIDLAGGTIDAMFAVNTTLAPQIKAGRVRLIGVTSDQPSSAYPDLPTMNSVAPGYNTTVWTAIFAPAGTPVALVQRLNREIREIVKSDKAMQDIMQFDGVAPGALSPEELARLVRESLATWKKIATAKNIVLD